jgi:multidrug efflux pump subunit AcrA (membrane-fusion protein)
MSLMDRVAAGLEALGKRANQALDEGKLRLELLRARRRMDGAARELGYVTYRQAKGRSAPEGEVESLTRRIADAEAEVARLRTAIDKLGAERHGGGPKQDGPAATDAASPSPDTPDAPTP